MSMIKYNDEDLQDIYGDKDKFLNEFITEQHKAIQVLDYQDDLFDLECPKCGHSTYVEFTEEDNKTYLYCEECEELMARYLNRNEYRYMQILTAEEE